MKLIKYDINELDPFSRLDQLFSDPFYGFGGSFFNRARGNYRDNWLPVNVYLDGDNYVVVAEVPGFSKKDIRVEIENAVLTLNGERELKNDESATKQSFSRSITVGDDVNPDKIKAKLENGLLKVTLPRSEDKKAKEISVS